MCLTMIYSIFFSYSTNKIESPYANPRYTQCLKSFSYLLTAVHDFNSSLFIILQPVGDPQPSGGKNPIPSSKPSASESSNPIMPVAAVNPASVPASYSQPNKQSVTTVPSTAYPGGGPPGPPGSGPGIPVSQPHPPMVNPFPPNLPISAPCSLPNVSNSGPVGPPMIPHSLPSNPGSMAGAPTTSTPPSVSAANPAETDERIIIWNGTLAWQEKGQGNLVCVAVCMCVVCVRTCASQRSSV